MPLTPSTLRIDAGPGTGKKCGKGFTSRNNQCRQTGGGRARGSDNNNTLRNVAVGLGTAAVVGGALYGRRKYKATERITNTSPGPNPTPNQFESQGRSAFRQARGVATGTEIAGAGLALAGAGVLANEAQKKPKQRSVVALGAGSLGLYLGAGTFGAGRAMRRGFNQSESDFGEQASQYRQQWNEARQQAREARQRARASGNRQGSRNVGANRAVSDPFKDLGVSENTSDAELRKRWKDLMRQNHPDLGGDTKKAQSINAAYQEIMRRRGRLDAVYAEGFPIDWSAIDL